MVRVFARLVIFVSVVFFVPAMLSLAMWAAKERPGSWRHADWGSAGILRPAGADPGAAVYVMAARTGGMKGALSVHSWIVLKRPGQVGYDRYDKVGWGVPVRRNAFAADGRWFSNEPHIVKEIHGSAAEALIAPIERAIAGYPGNRRGDYNIWPGPNSNSFVAYILRSVPEIGAAAPALAVGRDYLPGTLLLSVDPDGKDFHLSLFGLAGMAVGARSGFEIHFLGLVAGFDILRPGVKLPGFGRIGI